MDAVKSSAAADRSRPPEATMSRRERNAASARPPHRNSIRWPPLNLSHERIAMRRPRRNGDVRSAAGRQVEPVHLDESQRALPFRVLAQGQSGGLFGGGGPDPHDAVLPHHPIRVTFRNGDVIRPEHSIEIDGRRPFAEMKADGACPESSESNAADSRCCPVCCCM